jgi:peptidoglycan/LPS O-acetylase OafA/YrhL
LGVDLFFVLSGYLITSLLVDERLRTGSTDFLTFWVRRARRLLPALLLLLVVMAATTRILLPPSDWAARQADLVWALFYAANWHQIAASEDYFAQFQLASSLRHLWSLGIEEQFYIAWPLLIGLLVNGRRIHLRVPILIGLATIGSAFVMWLLFTAGDPNRAYYGTDSRAHELLVGALLAVLMRWSATFAAPRRRLSALFATLGIALVFAAFLLGSDTAALYYKGGSLLFSVSVAALLWAVEVNPELRLARWLGSTVPRWIGQLSYGLYLWHWPAIVWAPVLVQLALRSQAQVLLRSSFLLNFTRVGIAVTIAVGSYYLLEQPIRRGRPSRALTNVRVALATPTAAVLTLLFFISLGLAPLTTVIPGRDPNICPASDQACIVIHTGPLGGPVVALMGDSIALSMDPAFMVMARDRGWGYVMAAHNTCSVIEHWLAVVRVDGTVSRMPVWARCYSILPEIQRRVLATHPQLVVAYDVYLLESSLDDAGHLLASGTPEHIADTERRLDMYAAEVTAGGAKLALVHLLPPSQPANCARPEFAGADACRRSASADPRTAKYNAAMDRVAARHPAKVSTIDLQDVVCPGDRCPPVIDGVLLRPDNLHFSQSSALWLVHKLEARLPTP